jgi:hypothetical protein
LAEISIADRADRIEARLAQLEATLADAGQGKAEPRSAWVEKYTSIPEAIRNRSEMDGRQAFLSGQRGWTNPHEPFTKEWRDWSIDYYRTADAASQHG